MLSFDGKGINDRGQEYAPRVATFTNDEMAQKWGKLIAAAPELLEALQCAILNCGCCGGSGVAYMMEDEEEFGMTPGSSGIDCPGCRELREAIAKATGQD